jgi:hypothetical protein
MRSFVFVFLEISMPSWNKYLLAGLAFSVLAMGCTKVVTMPASVDPGKMRDPVIPSKSGRKEMPKPPPPPLPPS